MRNASILLALGVVFTLGTIYALFFTLDTQNFSQEIITASYQYNKQKDLNVVMEAVDEFNYQLSYKSFDGSHVNGQISFPKTIRPRYPVLIGVHAMGRSYPRWWVDSLKGRPTVTQVNKIGQLANNSGYVVIAIDARYHGSRKTLDKPLRSIMNALSFFGDRDDYVEMIRNTVLDHQVLLDWIEQQQNFDTNEIHVAGYSMGAQIGLILASIDNRISNLLAIVPPFIDDKTAMVAPKNLVSLLTDKPVLLVTADDDENASQEENQQLFNAIKSKNKKMIEFQGNHILPPNYVESLRDWF